MAVATAGTERLTGAPDRDGGAGHGYTSAMIKRAIVLLLLSCLLAACGNKGPLVLPEQPAAAPAVETPAETPAAPAVEPPANADAGTPARQR